MRLHLAGLHLLAAATVAARMALPPGEITIGDSVVLKLTVSHPQGAVIDYPDAAKLAPEPTAAPASEGEGQQAAPPRYLVEEVQPLEAKPPIPGESSARTW